MGWLTKLLGVGYLTARAISNAAETSDSSNDVCTEKKLPYSNLCDLDIWNNFFDLDLKNSPNELWNEDINYDDSGNTRRFEYFDAVEPYFTSVSAVVPGQGGTNFVFRGPYSKINAIDIYFTIEHYLMQRSGLDVVAASKELRGKFEDVFQSIRWQNDDLFIEMSRNITSGDIELLVMTGFYNSAYFQENI